MSHAATHSAAKPIARDNSIATRGYRWPSLRTSGKVITRLSSNAAVTFVAQAAQAPSQISAPQCTAASLWLRRGGAFGVLCPGPLHLLGRPIEAGLALPA